MHMALTELGTTFIKLGQMMSQSADMVGPELATELESLQADVPPDPPSVVRATIEEELKQPPSAIFAEFNQLALASVGQMHLACLRSGAEVVVKVQHAGIETKVKSDLSLLNTLAQAAESSSREVAQYRQARAHDRRRRHPQVAPSPMLPGKPHPSRKHRQPAAG